MVSVGGSVAIKTGPDGDDVIPRRHYFARRPTCGAAALFAGGGSGLNEPVRTALKRRRPASGHKTPPTDLIAIRLGRSAAGIAFCVEARPAVDVLGSPIAADRETGLWYGFVISALTSNKYPTTQIRPIYVFQT